MIQINNLTDNAIQSVSVNMPDGSTAAMTLYFRGTIQRWFFDFIHADFPNGGILGTGLCLHPNLFRNFINTFPFGLSCITASGQDPVSPEDFVNGNGTLYILDTQDVQSVETQFYTP